MEEKMYWFIAKTYVNLTGAFVSYFAFSGDAYGLHTTEDINDENICYYPTEAAAKCFAYNGIANTDRTVHARYLPAQPKNLIQ